MKAKGSHRQARDPLGIWPGQDVYFERGWTTTKIAMTVVKTVDFDYFHGVHKNLSFTMSSHFQQPATHKMHLTIHCFHLDVVPTVSSVARGE